MTTEMKGKVVLLTGGTEGIGKAAAIELARRGATLVLVGRSPEKTARVVAEVSAAAGGAKVDSLLGDLSTIAEVRKVAGEFRAKYDRLDVLANNAGGIFNDYVTTADGLEMTFALNHMSYFVLTTELLPLLEKTPGSRVVSTSSGAHAAGSIDLGTIARRKGSAGWSAYADSKLANILFTRELARRVEGKDVFVGCYHPGFVRTAFGHNNNSGFFRSVTSLSQRMFGRTPEKGAETLVWLATSDEAKAQQGAYFHDRKVSMSTSRAKDDERARGLWELSEKLCKA
jgi:retinol dehydrogenase-12